MNQEEDFEISSPTGLELYCKEEEFKEERR
jgi:hypothetical protein